MLCPERGGVSGGTGFPLLSRATESVAGGGLSRWFSGSKGFTDAVVEPKAALCSGLIPCQLGKLRHRQGRDSEPDRALGPSVEVL